jgi:hypothetical protein
MQQAAKWGAILAVLVVVLNTIFILSGLHANPIVGGPVFIILAIVVNVAVVFMALRATAATSTFSQQLLNGAVLGVVGGILVLLLVWPLLAVGFPNALDQMREGYIAVMQDSGVDQARQDTLIEQMNRATPFSQTMPGAIGTLLTSILAGAAIGIFLRRK